MVRGWQVGHACVIEQLGDVQARPGWQDTEGNFYWPKGFSSRRTFPSMRQEGKCSYQCEVESLLCLASLSCLFVFALLSLRCALSLCLIALSFPCIFVWFLLSSFDVSLHSFPLLLLSPLSLYLSIHHNGTGGHCLVSVPGSSSLLLPLLPAESRVLQGLRLRA